MKLDEQRKWGQRHTPKNVGDLIQLLMAASGGDLSLPIRARWEWHDVGIDAVGLETDRYANWLPERYVLIGCDNMYDMIGESVILAVLEGAG